MEYRLEKYNTLLLYRRLIRQSADMMMMLVGWYIDWCLTAFSAQTGYIAS